MKAGKLIDGVPYSWGRFTISQDVVEKIFFMTQVESATICSSKQLKLRKNRKKINPCKRKENVVSCST